MNENTGILPVFYTRDHADYKGTKVALWENNQPLLLGQKPFHFSGKIGEAEVKVWKAKSAIGPFFNIKQETNGQLVSFGTAVAYTGQGFNALSISLRFDSLAAAQAKKDALGIKEQPKSWKEVFFINVFADVSIKAVEAQPEVFASMGFLTGNSAVKARKPRP